MLNKEETDKIMEKAGYVHVEDKLRFVPEEKKRLFLLVDNEFRIFASCAFAVMIGLLVYAFAYFKNSALLEVNIIVSLLCAIFTGVTLGLTTLIRIYVPLDMKEKIDALHE